MTQPNPDPPLSIVALVPYSANSTPSQRYRIEQWAPELAHLGIHVTLEPFADETLTFLLRCPGRTLRKTALFLRAFSHRIRRVSRIPGGQIVFLHRAACLAGPPYIERWLRRRGHSIIYDFDDAIFLLHAAVENRRMAWLKQPSKTATICRLSNHVVVGNSYLAGWAERHNDKITVIPSSVDADSYAPLKTHTHAETAVVGWIGSSTSQTYLEAFAPMLRALVDTRRVELRVISDREPNLPGVPHTWRRWTAESEVAEIGGFDIGIMPMPDEEWALGKGAFKALQYMALGVPAVTSSLGASRDVIDHGMNGMLASTDKDWLECVAALAESTTLRTRLGREGRRTVEERFSMRKSAAALAAIVRRVAGGTADQ